ncbi:MAG: hypothetical protein ACR2PS_03895 [Pseudomonadales bacterium]
MRKNGHLNIFTIAIASVFGMMSMVAYAEDIVCSAAQKSSVNGVKKGQPFLLDRDTKLAGVRARHEAELMLYPNVVAVAEGVLIKQGKLGNAPCLVVYVTKKDVGGEAGNAGALPYEIEGIPIHIVNVGEIEPLGLLP